MTSTRDFYRAHLSKIIWLSTFLELLSFVHIDKFKTVIQQGKALELSFHYFPWLIKKESTNYNWVEDLNVKALASYIRKKQESEIGKK